MSLRVHIQLKTVMTWVLLLTLLAPAFASAQERDLRAIADNTPYTDQMVVTLKSTTTRTAIDTVFWRQFGDTATRSGLARASYKRTMSDTRYVL